MRVSTVLCVDANLLSLRVVQKGLANEGLRVIAAASIEVAERMIHEVDVVLLDWDPMGPYMLFRCEELSVPVVIFSGDPYAVPMDVRDRHRVLTTPIGPKDLALELRLAELDEWLW